MSNLAQTRDEQSGILRFPRKGYRVTPHQTHLAEQVSKETDSGKLKHLTAELCLAFDSEREENRQLRPGCWEDCREHQQMTA